MFTFFHSSIFATLLGALINAAAIIIGACLGLFFSKKIHPKLLHRLQEAMGLSIFFIGMKMCFEFKNALILISSLGLGLILGELLDVQKHSDNLSLMLEKILGPRFQGKFAQGFSHSSILFCTGAMGIVGSIESGIHLNHEILLSKSLIDGLLSIGLASGMGLGVAFSSVTIFIYEGVLSLFSSHVQLLSQAHIISEISGVGGALVAMIGIELAHIKKIGVANYLPALFVVVILSLLIQH